MAEELEGFVQFDWTYEGKTRPVYQKGEPSHPPVVLMHELPGMVPTTVQLARDLVDEGFCVWMPLLFGVPNAAPWKMVPYTLQICLSREFSLFAKDRSSPILSWLKSLCREAQRRCHNQQVGVIGMCLTGNFALTLMVDDSVLAPVLSQPSLPVGLTAEAHEALATPEEVLQAAQERAERENIPVMGLRFTCDPLCRKARFDALSRRFGSRFRRIELDSSRGNPHGNPLDGHSVLSIHRVRREGHQTQDAFRQVVAFLHEQLDGQMTS